ncbi:uncharacterized protein LOC122802006 [Protopterus annectens]|uniref:uncharacterized protein LOC122802006 n=1 Tax=Protopterus annectens TaxID=7888 RepID=UPI001CFBFB6C|nr:uncharacterized protein LOC122802006 [Protopterus annectens]
MAIAESYRTHMLQSNSLLPTQEEQRVMLCNRLRIQRTKCILRGAVKPKQQMDNMNVCKIIQLQSICTALLLFEMVTGMQFVTAVIGEKVVLNCTNHMLEVITAVIWKFDKEGSNCSFVWTAEGNMSSSKCELAGITLFTKYLQIFPAELSHTGNYTCRYDYNRGHECVEYNLTVTGRKCIFVIKVRFFCDKDVGMEKTHMEVRRMDSTVSNGHLRS